MRYIDLPEIKKKYKSARWSKTRKLKLESVGGFCERCLKQSRYNLAVIIHHKEYINKSNYVDDEVFFNLDNLEALCRDCHNKEHFKEEDTDNYFFDDDGNPIRKDKENGINRERNQKEEETY